MTVLQRQRAGVDGKSVGQFIGIALLMAAIGVGAFFAAEAIVDDSQTATGSLGLPPDAVSEVRNLEALRSAAAVSTGAATWSLPDAEVFGSSAIGQTIVEQLGNRHAAWSQPDNEVLGGSVAGTTVIGQLGTVHAAKSYSDVATARANAMADYYSAQAWSMPDAEADGVAGSTLIERLSKVHGESGAAKRGAATQVK